MSTVPRESVTTVRVNYSETDQMGVVYHARHVVWLDIARTEYLRDAGYSYRELEAEGLRLVVTDLTIRYARPARAPSAGPRPPPPAGATRSGPRWRPAGRG